jgi:hypothetical protein
MSSGLRMNNKEYHALMVEAERYKKKTEARQPSISDDRCSAGQYNPRLSIRRFITARPQAHGSRTHPAPVHQTAEAWTTVFPVTEHDSRPLV